MKPSFAFILLAVAARATASPYGAADSGGNDDVGRIIVQCPTIARLGERLILLVTLEPFRPLRPPHDIAVVVDADDLRVEAPPPPLTASQSASVAVLVPTQVPCPLQRVTVSAPGWVSARTELRVTPAMMLALDLERPKIGRPVMLRGRLVYSHGTDVEPLGQALKVKIACTGARLGDALDTRTIGVAASSEPTFEVPLTATGGDGLLDRLLDPERTHVSAEAYLGDETKTPLATGNVDAIPEPGEMTLLTACLAGSACSAAFIFVSRGRSRHWLSSRKRSHLLATMTFSLGTLMASMLAFAATHLGAFRAAEAGAGGVQAMLLGMTITYVGVDVVFDRLMEGVIGHAGPRSE